MATIKQIKDTAGTTYDIAVKWDNIEGKPKVGNGKVTIKQAGTEKGSFTLNQSGDATIELTDNNSHYTSKNIVGSSSTATSNAAVTSNGVYLNHLEESAVKSSHKISGSGTVSVTSDSNGNITITGSSHTSPGNGKITIKQAGTEKGSFTVNQSGATTIELTDTNTDTKVTSEGNHYTPTTSTSSTLSVDASGGTAAWSKQVVTGVNIERDSKGHITGLSVDSAAIPANPNTDSKTSTSNKASTKLYLVGAEAQASTGQTTYSNSKCYVGTDNCLYSNGVKVLTSHDGNDDTKNTTGTTNKASTKLFLAGAETQATNPVTYSNSNCYVGTDNCLYSGGKKVSTTDHTHSNPTDGQISYNAHVNAAISPIDAAHSNLHSANRLAFAKPAGITIEYSRDNGSTWTTYTVSDENKINLVSGIGTSLPIGARTSGVTVNDKLRVTINATNCGMYISARKFLLNITTNGAGGSNVKLEYSKKGSETTWVTQGTYDIGGWSGWNSIPFQMSFGGGSTQTANAANVRLTFGITSLNSSYSNALSLIDIYLVGHTYWTFNSEFAKSGHIYTYDYTQAVTFPANVSTKGGFKALNADGTAKSGFLKADGTVDINTYNNYSHPTSAGNKHIPSGGSSGKFLGWASDGTAKWVANPNSDTKVTAVGNHYTPTANSSSELTATLSGTAGSYAKDTEYTVLTGVKAQRDAAGHVTGITYTAQKIKDTNTDTDTKVTSVGNHYTPSPDSSKELTASLSGTAGAYAKNTEYTVLTGVKAQRDAAGHITGLTYTAQKIKDTNTTYSSLKNPNAIKFKNTSGTVITYDGSSAADLSGGVYYAATATNATTATNLESAPALAASGNNITVTAGGKTSSEFTVPYATSAGSATNATNDGGGNNISATYALKADFEGFTEYVESDFVKKTGSLKNPNAIKFKNKSGTVITYDGSSAADLSGGVYYAATAGSAKNPNAIKFKNALGTVITYDGSSAADLSGGVYNATTATNANNVKVNTSTANSNLPILFTTTYPSTGTKENASNRAVYVDSEKNKFYYNPNSNQVTAAGGFFETSDERLKDIVNPITVDLDKLSKLRKVYFNWKDKPDSDLQLGMIAQDVQELYPELVSEADGQLSLSYEKLSVIALEAIDVLHNENNELKSRIERLESLVNQLAEKVND